MKNIMNNIRTKSQQLDELMIKVSLLQVVAVITTCSIGMWMSTNELYIETIFLIPFHIALLCGILFFNMKMSEKILRFDDNQGGIL